MVPSQASLKSLRENQRQRSIGLSARARQLSLAARHCSQPGSDSANAPSHCAFNPTSTRLPSRPPSVQTWKKSKNHRAALQDDYSVDEDAESTLTKNRPELTGDVVASDSDGEACVTTTTLSANVREPIETPLIDLVKPGRSNLMNEYEIIPPRSRVIALSADDFGASAPIGPRHLSSEPENSSSSEDDDWEILGDDDMSDGSCGKRAKKMSGSGARTWASIVTRG